MSSPKATKEWRLFWIAVGVLLVVLAPLTGAKNPQLITGSVIIGTAGWRYFKK